MTSYLASLTQHYTTLKRLLPNSLSPDSDLSCTNPEDSHVSRVMRAYYTEKGRVFPPWLGPDPRAPEKSQPTLVSQSRYGQQQGGDDDGYRRSRGPNTPGALDDLFGNGPPPAPDKGREPPLRGPRGRLNQAPPGRDPAPAPTARPLPSQRQGSNQTRGGRFDRGYDDDPPTSGSGAPSREQTAAERLKARLGGGGSRSPAPSDDSSYDRPAGGGRSSGNPYDRGGNPYESGRSGGSRGNPYQSGSSRNPYDAAPDDRYGNGGARPYTAASSPWVSGDDGYDRSNGAGGGGYGRRAQGLPNNPRRR